MERTVHLTDDILDVDITEDALTGIISESCLEADIVEFLSGFSIQPDVLESSIIEHALDVSIIENILSVEITEIGTPSQPVEAGGGYNFLAISFPSDNYNARQDTHVTITGTTMRNSGIGSGDPVITINGTSISSTPDSTDANIYRFSHTVSLDAGLNSFEIFCDNESLELTRVLNVYRDDSIDITPPETTHIISGPILGGWYTGLPSITLSAVDSETGVDQTYYRYNGGSWNTYSSPVTINAQGSVVFEYYSVDNNGNTESVKSASLNIDTLAPSTTFSISGSHYSGYWYSSSVTVMLSASDTSGVQAIYMNPDGQGYLEGSSYTFSTDGEHTLQYYAVDILGHTETVHTLVVCIDTTPVVISDVTVSISDWYQSDGPVTIHAECGEDTTGWTGQIDLSSFGGSSSASMSPDGSTGMQITFTPNKQDAVDTPELTIRDRGGNSDTANAPIFVTHEYHTQPEDLYFPAFSYVSDALVAGALFVDPANVKAEWGAGYSRAGELFYGTDFMVIDNCKIELTAKWQDDVESNSLGNMYVTVWED